MVLHELGIPCFLRGFRCGASSGGASSRPATSRICATSRIPAERRKTQTAVSKYATPCQSATLHGFFAVAGRNAAPARRSERGERAGPAEERPSSRLCARDQQASIAEDARSSPARHGLCSRSRHDGSASAPTTHDGVERDARHRRVRTQALCISPSRRPSLVAPTNNPRRSARRQPLEMPCF